MRYRIVYEKTPNNYAAYSPDLPGCIAADKTLRATRKLMREAIAFHLEGLAEDGDVRPKPSGYLERFAWRTPARVGSRSSHSRERPQM